MAAEQTEGSPWLGALLLVSLLTLLFQLFPSLGWSLLSIIDVRGWSWRSYATVSTVAIVVLVAIKIWRDR